MMIDAAMVILDAAGVYAAIGLLVGIAFVLMGVQRVDPTAGRAGLGFRLAILPASVALWPMVARWWARAPRTTREPTERGRLRPAQLVIWLILTPALVAGILWVRSGQLERERERAAPAPTPTEARP
jgi:hypothetical protein